MKKVLPFLFLLLLSNNFFVYAQEEGNKKYNPDNPNYFIPKNHDPNFKSIPTKSFYESKIDWQYTIDTTWGAGDPLSQKLLIYNTFAQKVHDEFDGFISLNLNWDSLYNFYLNKITESTSKGAFSSIISHFAYDLKDAHTKAYDSTVVMTPLNPGIPILLLGFPISIEHFGAVTTILPDSTTLVLRVVPNHPLNLEPGDIILGYEGVPWKVLIKELLDAGLPMVAFTGGGKTADTDANLFGAGLNWHLFSTIDILKHSTGETQHLSVLPMLNLNVSPMANNEQLPIPNIPFPNVLSDECVTYGILENTNIGYIYLAEEWPTANADAQFYEAVNSLKNTDAMIIDMRLNYGGWALFENAFNILFNEFHRTIEDAYRCNPNTFELCPIGNWSDFKINGLGSDSYDRPISVLLGPNCVSMGDVTAQRLIYHPMVRFFGKSSQASLGDNVFIRNFPKWYFHYSISDMFHTNNPGVYLNRREFPIDFPVWHNPADVVMGKDSVVEKALDWINNVVYPHSIFSDKTFYAPGEDTVHITTTIENPNSHQLSARGYIYNLTDVLIDSVDLTEQVLNTDGEIWTGNMIPPSIEEFFKVSVTSFDHTASTLFTLPNATRFTTAGPVVLDSINITKVSNYFTVIPIVKNLSSVTTVTSATISLFCNDPWITSIAPAIRYLPNIPPGTVVSPSAGFTVRVDSTFTDYFNFNIEVMSITWPYWRDSLQIIVGVEDEISLPTEFLLSQNYPNPFNPTTTINWQLAQGGEASLKVYDILGREIATLVDEYKPAGKYETAFNAAILPSGVYFYQLKATPTGGQAGGYLETKKMILIK
ncbi:MAG: T9SS type A sorting domain-containing protein [Ignavibacteriaceae bacterium]|nr:T9SS type A sorting domain-containing protein [Ignavibacteriaceae bacterium]